MPLWSSDTNAMPRMLTMTCTGPALTTAVSLSSGQRTLPPPSGVWMTGGGAIARLLAAGTMTVTDVVLARVLPLVAGMTIATVTATGAIEIGTMIGVIGAGIGMRGTGTAIAAVMTGAMIGTIAVTEIAIATIARTARRTPMAIPAVTTGRRTGRSTVTLRRMLSSLILATLP